MISSNQQSEQTGTSHRSCRYSMPHSIVCFFVFFFYLKVRWLPFCVLKNQNTKKCWWGRFLNLTIRNISQIFKVALYVKLQVEKCSYNRCKKTVTTIHENNKKRLVYFSWCPDRSWIPTFSSSSFLITDGNGAWGRNFPFKNFKYCSTLDQALFYFRPSIFKLIY